MITTIWERVCFYYWISKTSLYHCIKLKQIKVVRDVFSTVHKEQKYHFWIPKDWYKNYYVNVLLSQQLLKMNRKTLYAIPKNILPYHILNVQSNTRKFFRYADVRRYKINDLLLYANKYDKKVLEIIKKRAEPFQPELTLYQQLNKMKVNKKELEKKDKDITCKTKQEEFELDLEQIPDNFEEELELEDV